MLSDWCRAQVVQSFPDTDEYDLKLVDYGGYLRLPGTSLRQIRYNIWAFYWLRDSKKLRMSLNEF